MGNPEALKQLEAIVHPLVTAYKVRWLRQQAAARQTLVVLDVPLLFETGAETMCDSVAVVSCPAEVQRARALARPGMTEAKLEGLLARQVWLVGSWGAACIVPCPGACICLAGGLPPPQPLNVSTLSLFCMKQVPDAEKRQRADFVIDTVRCLHAVPQGALFVHGPRCVRPPVLQLVFEHGCMGHPVCALPLSSLQTSHLCNYGSQPLLLQSVSLEETRQHVASMVEGLRGREGSKYAALTGAAPGDG